MNPSAWLQFSDLCDAEIALSAINALSDGLFLVEPSARTCRALNAAAATMVSDLKDDPGGALPLEKYFPEFELLAAQGLDDASHLAHFPSGKPGGLCDVYVQFRRLQLPGEVRENSADGRRSQPAEVPQIPRLLLAIVRRIGVMVSADVLSPRDAFDDAFHDSLTRLPNRQLFLRRLERAVRRGGASDYHFAVLFVDLDRFKTANDRFGHVLGDRLLVAAAHRLVEAVRPQDMVARRDGDEFTILLDDLDEPQDAVHVAERIVEHLNAPFLVEGTAGPVEVILGASIGVALPSREPTTAEQLIAQADAAMYHAKSLGGGTFTTLVGRGDKPKPR
jgi:diguanylate cyclase (GGDEF)-like protein